MLINCFIIDDEPLAIEVLKNHLSKIPEINVNGSSQNPLSVTENPEFVNTDLLFLDIQMPDITGLDFLKSINNPPRVIFTTAFREYALESYELDVVDYLLKPISFPRILKAINKYKSINQQVDNSSIEIPAAPVNDHLYVNVNKKFIKILFDEILYIESVKDYIRIYTDNESIVTKEKIGEFGIKMPSGFLRVHRSFIVNTLKIKAFTASDIEIRDKEIPIGASYKSEVTRLLRN